MLNVGLGELVVLAVVGGGMLLAVAGVMWLVLRKKSP